jgi:hypothetical protein
MMLLRATQKRKVAISTLEHHYPTGAITPPRYYADDEDYVIATGLV